MFKLKKNFKLQILNMEAIMTQTVIALFNNSNEATQAVDELVNNGFQRTNIDISNGDTNTAIATEYENSSRDSSEKSGIGRFFSSLFGEDEADKYTTVAERNSYVVTVHAQSMEDAERAADILDDYGAINVDEKALEYGYSTNSGITNKESMDWRSGNDSTSIPVVEENVQVGKREVETGGVRLKSRIIEKPVEENLRLREERVTVERTPVDREATDADLNNFQEQEIEIVEHAEVPVVSKEARVVEEVKLNKEVEHKDETVKETVRKTEVDVENLEGKDGKKIRNKKK
jgi:stress response protein YsnF